MDLSGRIALAGMTQRSSLTPGSILIPGVIDLTGDGDAIRWTSERTAPRLTTPGPDVLRRFSELFDAESGKILLFARQHGVLGLTEDGSLPDTPNIVDGLEPLERWRGLASQVRSIQNLAAILQTDGDIKPEHIAGEPPPICSRGHSPTRMRFRDPEDFCSHEAQTLRRGLFCVCPICYDVKPNESFGAISPWASVELQAFVPDDADFQTVDGKKQYTGTAPTGYFWHGKPFPMQNSERLRIAQTCLDWTIQDWLSRFPSTIAMERETVFEAKRGRHGLFEAKLGGELEAKLEYRFGLLSAIALQLMQVVARKSVHICSECKEPFIKRGGSKTERRPRADRDEFCEQCKKTGAVDRRADKRRREKKNQARQMYLRGIDAGSIADKLKLRNGESTVRLWSEEGKWDAARM
jgi:hypothetical protein